MENKQPFNLAQKTVAFFLTVVSCFGIIIPVAGFAYYLGYLGTFGLDTDTFPISLWDLWRNCVSVVIELVFIIPKYFAILLMIVLGLLTGFIYALIFHSVAASLDDQGWIPKFLKREIKTSLLETDRVSRWFLTSSKLPIVAFVSISLVLIAFLAFAGLASLGGNTGKKHLSGFQASGCSGKTWESCVTYSNPDNPEAKLYNGLLVAASSTHIAIFDGSSVSVIPRTTDYVLTRTYKGKNDDSAH